MMNYTNYAINSNTCCSAKSNRLKLVEKMLLEELLKKNMINDLVTVVWNYYNDICNIRPRYWRL
jgi:hypothetical protein